MSKSLPITSIKQASDDKLLKLIYENTLAGMDDKEPLLTPKEKDALVEEASKRKLYHLVKLHYDLATTVRFLRVDLDSQLWRSRFVENNINRMFEEYSQIGDLFTVKWLKPQNDDQKTYRDLIIKELSPYEGKKVTPSEQLTEWGTMIIKIKQYILEIKAMDTLFNYQVVSDSTRDYLKDTRFSIYVSMVRMNETLDEIIYDYNHSREFKDWINKFGIKRKHLKEANKIIYRHLPEDLDLTPEEKATKVADFKLKDFTSFVGNFRIEEKGIKGKDLLPVQDFINQIKSRYGIKE